DRSTFYVGKSEERKYTESPAACKKLQTIGQILEGEPQMKSADRNVRETGAESPTGADTVGPEDRIVPSDGRQEHHGLIQRCRSIIGDLAVRLERETPPLRVPRPVGDRRRIAGSPYHPYPEVFIQLSAATDFRMPEDAFTLYPGELCIMPRFIP